MLLSLGLTKGLGGPSPSLGSHPLPGQVTVSVLLPTLRVPVRGASSRPLHLRSH